jgi:hypothetical protein
MTAHHNFGLAGSNINSKCLISKTNFREAAGICWRIFSKP